MNKRSIRLAFRIAILFCAALTTKAFGAGTNETVRWGQAVGGLQLGIDCPSTFDRSAQSYGCTNIHSLVRNVTTNNIAIPVVYGLSQMCIVVEGMRFPCFYLQNGDYVNETNPGLWTQVRNLPSGTTECVFSCSFRDLAEPDEKKWRWAWSAHLASPRQPFMGTNRTMRFILAKRAVWYDQQPLQSAAISIVIITNSLTNVIERPK